MNGKRTRAGAEVGSAGASARRDIPNPEERLRKARLMDILNDVIERRKLSPRDIAEASGVYEADISRIRHGHGERYSTGWLLNVLAKLKVNVAITQRSGKAGETLIEVRELSRT
jgi:predicted XRE-type DNA-binding protein